MATKKLSEPMKKALLSADADGWIPSGVIKVETFCALIDRRLTGILVRRDDTMTVGHWLTDAGKAKVAELRGGKAAEQALESTLDDTIRAGDLIEIRRPNERRWAIRVEAYYGQNGWRGTQIRMVDGKPSRTRYTGTLKPGEYIIVERAKPATKAGHSSRCRAAIYAGTRFAKDWPRDPERCDGDACRNKQVVAAEQPRKTVTAGVKLTEAQIDVLHLLGAPEVIRQRYWMLRPHGRSLLAMRDRLYVERTSAELTEDGREAYLRCQPTGRLPQEFADAWAGTTVLASEPTPAVEPDGPACLADRPEDQVPLVRLNQMQAKRQTAAERGEILTPVEAVLWQVVEYANMVRAWGMNDQSCRDKLNDIERAIRKLEQR